MNTFFITGQPRSRTAWLANFFTTKDSYCFHEAIKRCPTPQDTRALFATVQKSAGVRFIGNSDSCIPFIVDELISEFPKAKLAVIERKREDVIRSFKKTFSQVSHDDAVMIVEKTQLALDRLKGKYNPLVVGFEELESEKVMHELWSYCLPHIPFDAERWRMLDGFKVEIIPEKYLADFPLEAAQRINNLIRNYTVK